MGIREMQSSAFEYIPLSTDFKSPFGRTHSHRDKNEMCIYCYNEDTEIVQEPYILNEYFKFYSKMNIPEFKVYKCHCCGVTSSWYKKNTEKGESCEIQK